MYGLFVFVAGTNWLLMRRPRLNQGRQEHPTLVVLIPARDEEANLQRLLPALVPEVKVYVFDDESSDRTAEVTRELGAVLVRPRETLPKGWTGKNRACHQLALAASEDSDAEWLLFMDADAHPYPNFVAGVQDLIRQAGPRCGVLTGFPTIVSGRGLQPLFLAWVGWILLCTNPYGLVSRTKKGHNRFTNGQFHVWRRDVYTRLWPNEAVRGSILEDVKMGRLCAKEGVPVEVANISSILWVKMYDTWRETLDGMSKNSHEVADSTVGTILLALLLLLIAWGWALAGTLKWIDLSLFFATAFFCTLLCRTKIWGFWLVPIAMTIGTYTMIRSMVWHRRGAVVWKGRTY
jgi:hypothetical protein